VLKFCFSVITLHNLTDLLHTHTQCCFGQDLYTDIPHCDLQMVGFVLWYIVVYSANFYVEKNV